MLLLSVLQSVCGTRGSGGPRRWDSDPERGEKQV